MCHFVVIHLPCSAQLHGVLVGSNSSAPRREYAARDATLGEDEIDILEREALGFREEAIDDRNPDSIEDGKDDESFPTNVLCNTAGQLGDLYLRSV